MRKSRAGKVIDKTSEAWAREKARSFAGVYLKRGKIQRAPCEQCGFEPAQMFHADYSDPLAIRWLCRGHLLEAHRNKKAGD